MNSPTRAIACFVLGFVGGFAFQWLTQGTFDSIFTGLFGSAISFYLINAGIPLVALGAFLLVRCKGQLMSWGAAGTALGIFTFQLIVFYLMWLVAGAGDISH